MHMEAAAVSQQEAQSRAIPHPDFEYVFPAIRGVQAQREFYISMCPLRLIPKMFLFDEDELLPEVRAQRTLNRQRLPEMARYMTSNRDSYVFSALTASIDAEVSFSELSGDAAHADRVGLLRIPMDARFVINDGQHRRAAIEMALKEDPDLADESIAVVFFIDAGLERSQQMFADLNRHAIRPSKSIGVLYDHRDEDAAVAKLLVLKSPVFKGLVEMESSTLSARSRRLFTLSAIYGATRALLEGSEASQDERSAVARTFWEAVAQQFPEWDAVREGRITAGEVRADFIHSHGIVLHSIGNAGRSLLAEGPLSEAGASDVLRPLSEIDWTRSNLELWEGRAMVGGRLAKSRQNVLLTTNVILKALGLDLPPENQQAEDSFDGARS
jgi:DNA sulfur modification protein DndB